MFIPANKGRRSYSSSNYNKATNYSISLHSKRKITNCISINVRYFSTSTLKLKLDSSKHTNHNNLPSDVNTIIAREYYYEQVYGRNQEEVINISEQLITSDELGYLRDKLDQVNSDIDAPANTHNDMQTRNQDHFNADTVRKAIVDHVMELEADNTLTVQMFKQIIIIMVELIIKITVLLMVIAMVAATIIREMMMVITILVIMAVIVIMLATMVQPIMVVVVIIATMVLTIMLMAVHF